MRIVWYFDACDQTRAFTICTSCGVAVAYDDVVDVNLKVWGDRGDRSLDRLVGTRRHPGRSSRVGQACGCAATSSSSGPARRSERSTSRQSSTSSSAH